jgi:hypothetical protein
MAITDGAFFELHWIKQDPPDEIPVAVRQSRRR